MGGETTISIGKMRGEETEATIALIRDYVAWTGVDLSFQGIEAELADFPSKYREPEGCFLVAREGGDILGCVGLKRLEAGVCEMKRLFVREGSKGRGIGRDLIRALIAEARRKGYEKMRLDTLEVMEKARSLYRSFGFREIGQYVENPLPGAIFMELELRAPEA